MSGSKSRSCIVTLAHAPGRSTQTIFPLDACNRACVESKATGGRARRRRLAGRTPRDARRDPAFAAIHVSHEETQTIETKQQRRAAGLDVVTGVAQLQLSTQPR